MYTRFRDATNISDISKNLRLQSLAGRGNRPMQRRSISCEVGLALHFYLVQYNQVSVRSTQCRDATKGNSEVSFTESLGTQFLKPTFVSWRQNESNEEMRSILELLPHSSSVNYSVSSEGWKNYSLPLGLWSKG